MRVRLSSKNPGVPATRTQPSQSRPAASPFGAGLTTGPKNAMSPNGDDRRADVVADEVDAPLVAGPQRPVVLRLVRRAGELGGQADLLERLRDDLVAVLHLPCRWIRVPIAS